MLFTLRHSKTQSGSKQENQFIEPVKTLTRTNMVDGRKMRIGAPPARASHAVYGHKVIQPVRSRIWRFTVAKETPCSVGQAYCRNLHLILCSGPWKRLRAEVSGWLAWGANMIGSPFAPCRCVSICRSTFSGVATKIGVQQGRSGMPAGTPLLTWLSFVANQGFTLYDETYS